MRECDMQRLLPCTKIKEVDANTVEVCHCRRPGETPHHSWRLSIQEATGIAEWWKDEGYGLTAWHLPIKNRHVGNIRVSMLSPEIVSVKMIDKYASVKMKEYSLPSRVVRHLADRFSDKHQ